LFTNQIASGTTAEIIFFLKKEKSISTVPLQIPQRIIRKITPPTAHWLWVRKQLADQRRRDAAKNIIIDAGEIDVQCFSCCSDIDFEAKRQRGF
jgi:TrmH family RNA methyltransferase